MRNSKCWPRWISTWKVKAKATGYSGGINFALMCLATVMQDKPQEPESGLVWVVRYGWGWVALKVVQPGRVCSDKLSWMHSCSIAWSLCLTKAWSSSEDVAQQNLLAQWMSLWLLQWISLWLLFARGKSPKSIRSKIHYGLSRCNLETLLSTSALLGRSAEETSAEKGFFHSWCTQRVVTIYEAIAERQSTNSQR